MNEQEKLIREIGKWLTAKHLITWTLSHTWEDVAHQLVTDLKLARLDDDQTLPPYPDTSKPPYKCFECGDSHFDSWSYEHGRSDMLKSGFRRVKGVE